MSERPRLLILSFSPIASDARVLKQVRLFAERYDVTTCGFGPQPHPDVEHVQVADPVVPADPRRARVRGLVTEALKSVRLYRAAYWRNAWAREARQRLRGRDFDVVLANDVDTVILARTLVGLDRLHVDLHEFWPLEGAALRGRRRLPGVYNAWVCTRLAGRAASTTTVGPGIAREYASRCGFEPAVVPNVPPFHALEPGAVGRPLRLVHAGVGAPSRGIHKLVEAALTTRADVTLDLFLVPTNKAYVDELRARAAGTDGRVTVHDPVPQPELVRSLNRFDVGVYLLEPQTVNSRFALPNKIFDFLQARLGVVVGPSPEMAALVRTTGAGTVADGFEAADLRRVLDDLGADEVARWKDAADGAATTYSAENVVGVWSEAIDAIVDRRGRA